MFFMQFFPSRYSVTFMLSPLPLLLSYILLYKQDESDAQAPQGKRFVNKEYALQVRVPETALEM
jgi:hypothetical protein